MRLRRQRSFARSVAATLVAGSLLVGCGERQRTDPPVPVEEALAGVASAREEARELGLVPAAGEELREAEESFGEALRLAREGDLAAAAARSEEAAASYRAAVLQALEEGPALRARTVLEQAESDLPEERRALARQRLVRIDGLLNDAREGGSTIAGLADRVREAAVGLEELVGADTVFDPLCSLSVAPELLAFEVSAPASGALLVRPPVHYLVGGELDVALEIPACTRVSEITVDVAGRTRTLATDASLHDPIEGTIQNPHYYSVLETAAAGEVKAVALRLHFPPTGDGRSLIYRLRVTSLDGSLSAEREIQVASVHAVRGRQILSIAEHQMRNDFVAGTYQDFGDSGRRQEGALTLKSPSYKALTVDIRPDGVHFASKVKAELSACDPTIGVNGVFRLARDDAQVVVEWEVGPNVGVTMPLLCEIAGLVLEPYRTIARILVENKVESRVREEIQQQVDDLIAELDDGNGDFSPAQLIERFETVEDELLVYLATPGDSVVLQVPYTRLRLQEPQTYGMLLSPDDEKVLVSGQDLADVCRVGGAPPQGCETTRTGAGGLFNWAGELPVPSPWPCSELGTCAYFKQRHEARKRLVGLRRRKAELPFPDAHVGALVARLSEASATAAPASRSVHHLVSSPCAIPVPDGSKRRIAFGANDHRFVGAAELGSGNRRVHVSWPSIELSDNLDCEKRSLSLADLLQELGTALEGGIAEP